MWHHAIRKTACLLVLYTVVALLFVASTTMSASAASTKTTTATKTGGPLPPPNNYSLGWNQGFQDGQYQCLVGYRKPRIDNSNPSAGWNQGYALGLSGGFYQGCPAVTQAPNGSVSFNTPQAPNYYQEGIGTGSIDGQNLCMQGKPLPSTPLQSSLKSGWNDGYAQGVPAGFHRAGC